MGDLVDDHVPGNGVDPVAWNAHDKPVVTESGPVVSGDCPTLTGVDNCRKV